MIAQVIVYPQEILGAFGCRDFNAGKPQGDYAIGESPWKGIVEGATLYASCPPVQGEPGFSRPGMMVIMGNADLRRGLQGVDGAVGRSMGFDHVGHCSSSCKNRHLTRWE